MNHHAHAQLCAYCGRALRIRRSSHQYCSRSCQLAAYNQRRRGRPQPSRRSPRRRLTCPECGGSFLGRRNSQYCSRSCQLAAYNQRRRVAA